MATQSNSQQAAITHPALHQPVGLPLVTNGPDNANDNNANNNCQRGRCWGYRPG